MGKASYMESRKNALCFGKVILCLLIFVLICGEQAQAFSVEDMVGDLFGDSTSQKLDYLESWDVIIALEEAYLETKDDTNLVYQEYTLTAMYYTWPEDWMIHAELTSVMNRFWAEADDARLANNDPDALSEYKTIVAHNNHTFEYFPLYTLLTSDVSAWYTYENDKLNGYFTYLAASIMSAYASPEMEEHLMVKLADTKLAYEERTELVEMIKSKSMEAFGYAADLLEGSILVGYPKARLE